MFRGTGNCYLGCKAGAVAGWAAQIFSQRIGLNMSMESRSVMKPMLRTSFAAALCAAACLATLSYGHAQGAGPFAALAGRWSGAGTIELSNGAHEPIHCKASYDVLSRDNMQLNIRCASESYNFDLRGSAKLTSGTVSGTWSESTRNAAGSLSGDAKGERIQLLAKGPGFAATLGLTTRGARQTVVIKSQDQDSAVRGASINLKKG